MIGEIQRRATYRRSLGGRNGGVLKIYFALMDDGRKS